FRKKLAYLDHAMDQYRADIIKHAILSDLADELLAYGKYKRREHVLRDQLSVVLLDLKTLSEYTFSTDSDMKRANLSDLLLRFDYFATRLPTFWDKIWPFKCRRIDLRDLSLDTT